MKDLSDSEREQIVGTRLAGASVTKTATLISTLRTTIFKDMSPNTNHGKTTSAKRNSGRKSALTERDNRTLRRIVSKNHRNTPAQVTGQRN
jgi:IS30 family transposase